MSYTKGPWIKDYGGTIGHIKSVPEGAQKGVTKTPTVCKYLYDTMAPSLTKEEREANAKLISAAPDLLEALKDIADSGLLFGPTELHDKMRTKMYAAINKAENNNG